MELKDLDLFTDEEVKVVTDYLYRKIWRLEDSGLKDSYCYPKLLGFVIKLERNQKKLSETYGQTDDQMTVDKN